MKKGSIIYRIYDDLKAAKGKENAIPAATLAIRYYPLERDGLRAVREAIREIRRSGEFDNVIASCNGGYYWATENEASEANRRLFAQGFDLIKTAWANERKAQNNGQMLMKLTPYQRSAIESLCTATTEGYETGK